MTARTLDFLLELRCEEIPARMQARAREDLARLFTAELEKAGISPASITTHATPRRLALIAYGLPEATQAVREETKGPRVGAPDAALEGFLRKTGATRAQLVERDGVVFAVVERAGRATAEVLAEAIPAIVRAFPWPKSMRWGAASESTESPRWVRPLQGIVALLGERVVPCEVAGLVSGRVTMGHRFRSAGPVEIASPAAYVEALRQAHVIVDQDTRAAIIRAGATELAARAGLVLIEDEGLVAENAGLTEWPVPLLGRFDEAFLRVPPEVIQLTARVNQKYFVCRGADGALANGFVCVANIDAPDGGARIVEGNRKVLAARLSDARFFYETDLKVPLEAQAEKLAKIVFHEKLGTLADKVERVARLARWLVEQGIVRGAGADDAERAARLCKADLVTGMVGEFPELQGLMGGYYAAAQGERAAVAEAIRDHYKPVGQGDDVPTAPVTVAVSLADKLDTLAAFYCAGQYPTGSKDPYALRRAMLGLIALVAANKLPLPLFTAFSRAADPIAIGIEREELGSVANISTLVAEVGGGQVSENFQAELRAVRATGAQFAREQALLLRWDSAMRLSLFFADRLKVQQREAGVRHDLIDAVFALGGEDDLVRLLARVRALQSFITTDDGANLLAGYRRAANILKKEGVEATLSVSAAHTPEPAEAALTAALDAVEPVAATAIEAEDFEGAMAALARLRAPIDAFFDQVTVNDADPAKRAARLALLARVRAAVARVADFDRIEG